MRVVQIFFFFSFLHICNNRHFFPLISLSTYLLILFVFYSIFIPLFTKCKKMQSCTNKLTWFRFKLQLIILIRKSARNWWQGFFQYRPHWFEILIVYLLTIHFYLLIFFNKFFTINNFTYITIFNLSFRCDLKHFFFTGLLSKRDSILYSDLVSKEYRYYFSFCCT